MGLAGTDRAVGIGTLGLITARSIKEDLTTLMQQRRFTALALQSSYFDVPQAKLRTTRRRAPPRQNVWINKTGSTNGFGAHVALVLKKRLTIVMLANRNVPTDARVSAAYRIMTALAASGH
jgi:CubicO group peptidase (beta-lactamase class C family)